MSYDESRAPGTITAMLRALGGIGPPGGPLLYTLRSITVTATSATVLGGALAGTCQALFGTGALGFVLGSCIGFVASSIGYFIHCRRHSMNALERFPSLMQMHLMSNYKLAGFERLQLERDQNLIDFRREVASSWKLKCWVITAWQSAASSIEEVERRREADLVADLSAKSR